MQNLNEFFARMIALLTSAYADKWPLVKDSVDTFIQYARPRFTSYIQMAADGVDADHMLIFLKAEEQALLQQLQTLEVISMSSVQEVANEAIQIFADAFLPLEVKGTEEETDGEPGEGKQLPQLTNGETTTETEPARFLSADQETISPYASKNVVDGRFTFVADPVYGVCFADESDIDTKINIAKLLGAKGIRMTIALDNYNGKSAAFEKIDEAGFGVYLNVYNHSLNDANGTRIPQPFPTGDQLSVYQKKVGALLDKYRPKILFVENEELADLFHTGKISAYVDQLKVTIIEAHMRGILVSNGGLTNPFITILAYRSLLDQGRMDDAKLLLNTAMDTRIQKACTYPGSNADIESKTADAAYLVQMYGSWGIDFVNFHWYEYLKSYKRIDDGQSTTGAMMLVVEYLQAATGKKVICNEMGQHNDNASLTASMLQDVKDCNLKLMIWFSATSRNGATFPLNDGLKLNACGNAYKDFVKQ